MLAVQLQEIKAVDRIFPALSQTEMQLACMHVLEDALSESKDTCTLDGLPMPTRSVLTDPDAHSNGSTATDTTPGWLQRQDELDEWVLQNLKDGERRLQLVKVLTQMALPFQYGSSRVVQALGDMYSENVS